MAAVDRTALVVGILIGMAGFSHVAAEAGGLRDEKNDDDDVELQQCLADVSEDCMLLIAGWITFDEALPPTEGCCTQLLGMGKECHVALVDLILEEKKYKGALEDVARRSGEVWEFCAFEDGQGYYSSPLAAPAPAPVPALAPAPAPGPRFYEGFHSLGSDGEGE